MTSHPDEATIEIQTRLAYQEQTICSLNDVILELVGRVALLEMRTESLSAQLLAINPSPVKDLSEEAPPPHY